MKNINKLPFEYGKTYTCISDDKRSDDSFFEIGKKYQCVFIKDPHKYSSDLNGDNSTIKFETDNGTIVTYFGSIAEKHFSNNIDDIRKTLEDNIIKYEKNIEKKKKEYEDCMYKMNTLQFVIKSLSMKKTELLTKLTDLIK